MSKKYHPCPANPNPETGNVPCDTLGWCPYSEVCNVEIKQD